MDLNSFFNDEIQEHKELIEKVHKELYTEFEELLEICLNAIKNGNKILFFGNGGSAADAQHLATELCVRFIKDRAPIPAIALTTDTSSLTAIGNDYGFEDLFARQVDALGQKGDVAVGISTSGTSENVNRALKMATQKSLTACGLSGRNGGAMKKLAKPLIIVPSEITSRIQEIHILLGHMLCGALEQKLGLV